MVRPVTSSPGKEFINSAASAAGSIIVGGIIKHVIKHHKPEDPCGCKRLFALIGLAYLDVKKSIFGAGPRHLAAAAKLRAQVTASNPQQADN